MFSLIKILRLAGIAGPGVLAAELSAYNVDPNSVSVSGFSAGGFMAAQLGVAYSDTFKIGFGVLAGGPYDCARNQHYTNCMYNLTPSITQPVANMKSWSGNQIDPIANLPNRKIYMQVGSADTTVGPKPLNQLKAQLANFVGQSKVSFVTTNGAAHVFPTDFSATGNNNCGRAASPYISNCGYDGAGDVLKWMYGALNPRTNRALSGTLVSFAQTGTKGASGMDTTGYLYVPQVCQDGSTVCKLHVALHGCQQSYGHIGSKFIDNTGYNKWADANKIIILYPQAKVDHTVHSIWGGTMLSNSNACFDWMGWYGSNADQRGGAQVAAMVNQVNKITSGYTG
ncbi:hypothetical protein FOVG_19466 [Fusarium oxysporum f. sp. pisi HDV247]|uniref:Peptidase S9 prolyl oligopeptidase catalytic domain-containing protein n=1 Tax=Fusarium oxysporum f. sp. pisi HDV247 TaxID=1080344 RepID=W9NE27_FUSOX|nr:hypothetical protein FOVG_19466 [Fusarium oxysporum f. sp. pisi HDV247]